MQPKTSEATQHTRPSAKRRSLEIPILWPLLKRLLKPPEFLAFQSVFLTAPLSFQSGGAGSFGWGASAAKFLAQNYTTRGGHTFNGKGYAALPLSARAGVRARLGRTARSRNEARRQQRGQSKADKESAKAEEQGRWLNLPARSAEVDFGNHEVSAFSFSNRLYDSKRGQRCEHPGCKTPAVKVQSAGGHSRNAARAEKIPRKTTPVLSVE